MNAAGRQRLILASGSPRRRELLLGLGLDFQVRPVDLDESPLAGEAPEPYVRRLARDKARAQATGDEVVLAADTTVVCAGEILGKPADTAEARRMLATLAGRDHHVWTGVAVHRPGDGATAVGAERTRVTMAPMTPSEVDWYAATGEPDDKAGAYAIQGLGALYVAAIDGNYTNVVGLPLPLVYRLFTELGMDLRTFRR